MIYRINMLFLITSIILLINIENILIVLAENEQLAKLESELEIDDLELVDVCESYGRAKFAAFQTQDYNLKRQAEELYGTTIKHHSEVLKKYIDNVPSELERNWTYQVKPGDGLLPEAEWKKFIIYANHIEETSSQTKLQCLNKTEDCFLSKSDLINTIKNSKNLIELKTLWNSWNVIYNNNNNSRTIANNNKSNVMDFVENLQSVKVAAKLNGFSDVLEYWEDLSDFPGGYGAADKYWNEIEPFYKKLVNFVKIRLFKYYNITDDSNEIPAYLLGSLLGNDWSSLASIVLPHPQLHYDVETYLKYRNVKDIYKYPEMLIKILHLGELGEKFWQNSQFNASNCGPELFEFCASDFTQISECDTPSWTTYLDAHQTTMKIALNNIDYNSLPRNNLRFSALDDAVETLGSLLAIEGLPYHGILDTNVFGNTTIVPAEDGDGDDNNDRKEDGSGAEATDSDEVDDRSPALMTKLLLAALRVMPRLSYYFTADKWRLNEIRSSNNSDIVENWWKYRKNYQLISDVSNNETNFLYDPHIVYNKPYISKFFGTLIAFQFIRYYADPSKNFGEIVTDMGNDESFKTIVFERHTKEWPYLLSLHYGLEVTPKDLLTYFKPLEKYLDTAPLNQAPIIKTTTTTTTTTIAPPRTKLSTTKTTTSAPAEQSRQKETLGLDTQPVAVVINDEPRSSSNGTDGNGNSTIGIEINQAAAGGSNDDNHVAMYVGIGLLIVTACLVSGAVFYKKLRRKRRPNNRRFAA